MKKKLELLQIFRGFAAMLVVLCHISGSTRPYFHTSFLGDIFFQGYIGVDFFFVLSGFIITYVHFKDLIHCSNQTTFLKKRFIRIYPFYWIIATVYLLLIFLLDGKTNHLDHNMDFRSAQEWCFIVYSYLLLPVQPNFFLPVAWSLAYEVIFYITFFICIMTGLKTAKYIFFVWLAAVLLKMFLSELICIPNIILLNERIVAFLCGCFVAYLILKSYHLNVWIWAVALVLSLLCLVPDYPHILLRPHGIMVLAIVMSLIIYRVVIIDITRQFRYPAILLLVGEASYSIYLSHLIFLSTLFRLFRIIVEKLHIYNSLILQSLIFILFLFTIAGGVLIFRFVESPVLRFFNRKLL
ncbi:Peptidoglycan/LPS O-acetylase OafA/YrhL, contains acyltransferase and SGNH-hydrolase domains [Dyadobacter koreensis]|uniref:Peptidoglycan/LPS O-acetylase OafA/YrhL, contains acyltransferase and SGNH-hydrolase domains n=1 Tax=Dyadobacter koreensis TaxID=408657 RepID=A0A1H6Q9C7_9BACT|nr:acyltransferase [Dyadobacter koreensis]SEI40379.1 Peptidoglycan/LPS O-acetylase OafA/YrhL, contains acyltransferase and SGNH-hydrolase domains [Dyadobacter koreensis]